MCMIIKSYRLTVCFEEAFTLFFTRFYTFQFLKPMFLICKTYAFALQNIVFRDAKAILLPLKTHDFEFSEPFFASINKKFSLDWKC